MQRKEPEPIMLCGPFRGSQALAEDVLTRKQLRSGLFVNLFRDVYLPSNMSITHETRCRAAHLIAPRNAVFTGHSAAVLRGVELASTADPVELIIPDDEQFRPYPGMNVRHVVIRSGEYAVRSHLRIANPQRIALDILLNSRLRKTLGTAVAALDVLLHQGFVDLDRLRATLDKRHDHGIVRARRAAELADARAESIPESLLRVLLIRAGFAVTPQVEVRNRGRFIARVDLAVNGFRIAVEYDGEWHADPRQAAVDAKRRQRLAEAGWRVIVVRKDDLYQDPESIVRAVQRAISAENALTWAG